MPVFAMQRSISAHPEARNGVKEVVFVYLPEDELKPPRHHYLEAAVPVAREALKLGARVTLVRPSDEAAGPQDYVKNGLTHEEQFLKGLLGSSWLGHPPGGDEESDNDDDPERLTRKQASDFRIISEEEYAMEVGQEAFKLETWWGGS
ncbi:hypothetical protein A1Q2_00572 [Trichosporon asahii var. asahii CBS 8904]|uniref:Uncharacterized protein n=2 Tax=Trichosporon asahii var. asahii TaxID=189963 RepID=K1VXC7_TRIAC|nr:hypothetical protein A1Q1_03966 [Trichosporon asahii var. asahii CBS 2479]EJT52450.1 hypothetical protein A1Q1_03966 [Trichosporon asahii var. asahii CBS 2479]EKD05151.1 hypothetical protein A1Q2_00572 [Trichosporon asahii var. asahii CBS 8904]